MKKILIIGGGAMGSAFTFHVWIIIIKLLLQSHIAKDLSKI